MTYTLLVLTTLVAALVAVVVFALVRLVALGRRTRSRLRESAGETAFVTAALDEAMTKLKSQERAVPECAKASAQRGN